MAQSKGAALSLRSRGAAAATGARRGPGRLQTGLKRTDFVTAFARGLDIIRVFGADRPRHTIATVAEATGMNRAAARRLLLTLAELGYARCEGELFELTPRVLELGHSYIAGLPLGDLVRPYLQDVVAALNENCVLGVLDQGEVVHVARVNARRIVQSEALPVGARIPAAVASIGRVVLSRRDQDHVYDFLRRWPLRRLTHRTIADAADWRAMLAQVRAQGWSLVDEELEEGLRAIATPVVDRDGVTIAAIAVTAPTSRMSARDMVERCLPHLQQAGREISRTLAMSGGAGVDELLSLTAAG